MTKRDRKHVVIIAENLCSAQNFNSDYFTIQKPLFTAEKANVTTVVQTCQFKNLTIKNATEIQICRKRGNPKKAGIRQLMRICKHELCEN